jgi:hypothetical protein
LNWAGFCMMVTIRSSSSELSSPALERSAVYGQDCRVDVDSRKIRAFRRSDGVVKHDYLSPHSIGSKPDPPSSWQSLIRDHDCLIGKDRQDSPLVHIHISLLADQVGISSTNTLDFGQGEHDLSCTLDVGVQETENVLFVERAV